MVSLTWLQGVCVNIVFALNQITVFEKKNKERERNLWDDLYSDLIICP